MTMPKPCPHFIREGSTFHSFSSIKALLELGIRPGQQFGVKSETLQDADTLQPLIAGNRTRQFAMVIKGSYLYGEYDSRESEGDS
jgi:hypothetical protein